jgi:hypothetical protein
MALPMKALMMVEASILVVKLELEELFGIKVLI